MIYLFSGNDTKNKTLSYEKFVRSIPKTAQIFPINRNDLDQTQIESFYSGATLFSPLSAIVFQNILEYEETREFALEKLELMANSENSFIFLEGKLNKPILDTFKKVEAKRLQLNIFELPKEKLEKFDNFLVANAFAEKNKFNTWTGELLSKKLSAYFSGNLKTQFLKRISAIFPKLSLNLSYSSSHIYCPKPVRLATTPRALWRSFYSKLSSARNRRIL